MCKYAAGEDDVEKAPCCSTVAAVMAGAEQLSYHNVVTAGADARVSPAVLSSNCSSMAAALGLDG